MSTSRIAVKSYIHAVSLLLIFFSSATVLSGVTRGAIDFQLFFFGNTRGQSVMFQTADDGAGAFSFAPIWKLPEIVNQFTRGYETRTLIINVGNNEHPAAPVSYLLDEPIFEHRAGSAVPRSTPSGRATSLAPHSSAKFRSFSSAASGAT
ncbi:MAG TPA: hypothetical protein PKO06_01365 [Candidatus Ozemobacteraceae bacterium]|nr:hypothetical protein [Candidatus Ozemobacteraceae bacterium]